MSLESLQARLQSAQQARDAAVDAITDDERAEIELRRQIAVAEEERRKAETEKRELALDRLVERARAEHGEDAKITSILVGTDGYVLLYRSAAYRRWKHDYERAIAKKGDTDKPAHELALASIICWNDIDDFSLATGSENGLKLVEHLKRTGAVDPIVSAVIEVAGLVAEARKS